MTNVKHPKFEVVDDEPIELNKYISLLSIPILNESSALILLKELAAYIGKPMCIPTNIKITNRKCETFGVCYFEYYKNTFDIKLYRSGRNLGTLLHEWTHGVLLHLYPSSSVPRSKISIRYHGELFQKTFIWVVESFAKMCMEK